MDISFVLAQLTGVFAASGLTLTVNAESFKQILIQLIAAQKESHPMAVNKLNKSIVPPELYYPHRSSIITSLILFMNEPIVPIVPIEPTVSIEPDQKPQNILEIMDKRFDSIISMMETMWPVLQPLLKSLHELAVLEVEDVSNTFECVEDRNLCIALVNGNKKYLANLNDVTAILTQMNGTESEKMQAVNFLYIVSLIVTPGKEDMLNSLLQNEQWRATLTLVSNFFVNIFMQYYMIRLTPLQYLKLHSEIQKAQSLELIAAEANMYFTAVMGTDAYKKLMDLLPALYHTKEFGAA
jgi:hypothetical protein